MAKKHGRIKDGAILRRGNNTGSLFRKRDTAGRPTGPWIIRWTERDPVTGSRKRVCQSTKTEDLEAARKILDDKAREYGFGSDERTHIDKLLTAKRNEDNERDRIEREKAKREAADRAAREAAEQAEIESNALRLKVAFFTFRDSKRRPDSGTVTLDHYESQYNRFVSWVQSNHPEVTMMRQITPELAAEFIGYIEKTFSRNTRNKYLVFLRMFWRVMRWEKDALLTIDPWDGIRNLTTTPDEIVHKELTSEELAKIGSVIQSGEPLPIIRDKGNAKIGHAAGNIRDCFTFQGKSIRDELRVLFALGIWTGQRLGDCATLTWGNVDGQQGIITLTPRKTARKYARQVIIPLHPVLASILADYGPTAAKRKGEILPTLARIYTEGDPSIITRAVRAIMQAAGIETDAKGENGTRTRTLAGFHSLRHTFSSIMLNAGVSPAHVDAMLCHAKGSMTMRYFHENAEALALAVSKLPILPQFTADGNTPRTARKALAATERTNTQPTAANSPRAVLDALRAALVTMTDEELKTAERIIRDELANRDK